VESKAGETDLRGGTRDWEPLGHLSVPPVSNVSRFPMGGDRWLSRLSRRPQHRPAGTYPAVASSADKKAVVVTGTPGAIRLERLVL